MRSVQELKAIKDRRPFEPFHLHLADGRDIRIVHPDNVAWNAGEVTRHVYVAYKGGEELLDLTLIVGVRVPNPSQLPPDRA